MGRKRMETSEQRDIRMRRWYILGIVGTTRFVSARLERVSRDHNLSPRTRSAIIEVLRTLQGLRHELAGDLERLNKE